MQSGVASLSRYLQSTESGPILLHSLHQLRSSVLSLAASEDYIFSGSQNEDISVIPSFCNPSYLISDITKQVWDKKTFTLTRTLHGHTGSVLTLEYAKDKQWLFSSSGKSRLFNLKFVAINDRFQETAQSGYHILLLLYL